MFPFEFATNRSDEPGWLNAPSFHKRIIFIEEQELLTLKRYIDNDLRLTRKKKISLLSMTKREKRKRREKNLPCASLVLFSTERYEKKTQIEKRRQATKAR